MLAVAVAGLVVAQVLCQTLDPWLHKSDGLVRPWFVLFVVFVLQLYVQILQAQNIVGFLFGLH
jgi:hypothetical protein